MTTLNRTARTIIAFAVLGLLNAVVCFGDGANWIEEPHEMLRLSIGEQDYKIESAKSMQIVIDGQEKEVSVNPDRYRTFKTQSFAFDYPAKFRYRREKIEPGDDNIHFCRLDGDGIVVRIAEKTPKLDFTSFATYFREKHPKIGEGMVVTEKREEFTTANVTLDEITFVMNGTVSEKPFFQVDRCFLIPSGNKDTCVILIASISSAPPSEEAKDFIDILGKTFTIATGR